MYHNVHFDGNGYWAKYEKPKGIPDKDLKAVGWNGAPYWFEKVVAWAHRKMDGEIVGLVIEDMGMAPADMSTNFVGFFNEDEKEHQLEMIPEE
jgi:hypothetical protein